MEEAVLIEAGSRERLPLIVAPCNGGALEQYLVVFAYLHLDARQRTSYRTHGVGFAQTVVRHCGQTLRQAIAHHHVDTDGVDELLDLGRHRSTGSREEMSPLKTQLLAYLAEHGLVVERVTHGQCERRTASLAQIFDIVLMAHLERRIEEEALGTARIVDFGLHAGIYFLPETGHAAHAGGVRFAHRLLYLLGVGIDDELCAHGEGQDGPSTLEDMRVGQEVHHQVVFTHRYALSVGAHGGMILPVGQDDTLAVAGGAAGVEDIADILLIGLGITLLHLRLTRQVLSQF